MRNLDVDEGGAQYLPFAYALVRKLHKWMTSIGLDFAKRHYKTPDGSGDVYIRTLRAKKYKAGSIIEHTDDEYDTDVWQDHIRIESTAGDFVFAPYVRVRASTNRLLVPNDSIFVPFNYTGTSPIQGNAFACIKLPHSTPTGNRTVTGLNSRSRPLSPEVVADPDQNVAAAYVEGVAEIYPQPGLSTMLNLNTRGVFRHTYTDALTGAQTSRLLVVLGNGQIRDSVSGDALSTSGPTITSTDNATWLASKDGRILILNFNTPSTKQYLCAVDFTAGVQVVVTDVTDATYAVTGGLVSTRILTPAGSHSYSDVTVTNDTGQATMTIAKGIDVNGDVKLIQGVAKYQVSSIYPHTVVGDNPGIGVVGPVNSSGTISSTSTTLLTLDVVMPNGFAAQVEIQRRGSTTTVSSSAVYSSVNNATLYATVGSGIYSETSASFIKTGSFNVIYCDPQIPILFYKIAYDEETRTDTIIGSASGELGSGTQTVAVSTVSHQVLGVITGTRHTELAHKQAPAVEVNTVLAFNPVSFIDMAGTRFANAPPWSGGSGTTVTTAASNITSNISALRKKVRECQGTVNGLSYVVAAKNVRDWVLGVTNGSSSISAGYITPDFDVYAGRINRNKLRQKYLEYLAVVLAPSQPAVAADIAAGNLAPYEIRLNIDDTGSYI